MATGKPPTNKAKIEWGWVIQQLKAGHLLSDIALAIPCARQTLQRRAKLEFTPEEYEAFKKLVNDARYRGPKRRAKCGTASGYTRHMRDKTRPCLACCDAHAKRRLEWVYATDYNSARRIARANRKKSGPPKGTPTPWLDEHRARQKREAAKRRSLTEGVKLDEWTPGTDDAGPGSAGAEAQDAEAELPSGDGGDAGRAALSPNVQATRPSVQDLVRGGDLDLSELNRDELRVMAAEYNIAGRGSMNKAELYEAVKEKL